MDGDSQFVAWSTAHIANYPLLKYPGVEKLGLDEISKKTREKAYKIIEAKGSTYYGVGGCTSSSVASILGNTKQVRPVSHFISTLGCSLSMPACIGRKGIVRTLPLDCNPVEQKQLEDSARSLKKILAAIEFGHED
jgi:L-lactate dehydrogenase